MPKVSVATALAGLAAFAVAGCTKSETPATSPPASNAADECGAQTLQNYLGMVAAGPVGARLREAAGDKRIRFIGPDDAVTMDYRPDRLNVETNATGKIVRIRCG